MQPTILRTGGVQLVRFEQSQQLVIDDKADLRVDELTLFVVCRSTVPHSPIIGYPVLNATGDLDLNWSTLSTYSYRTLKRDLYVNGNSFFHLDGEKRIEYPAPTALWVGGFAGDAAEILLYRGTLTDADRKEVEQHLVRKWAAPK